MSPLLEASLPQAATMSYSIPPTPDMANSALQGQRSFSKCAECRKLKRKCTPVDRIWPAKCDSCIKGRRPCGPNEPHHRMVSASQPPMPAYTPSYTPQSELNLLSTDPSFTEEEMPFADASWAFQPTIPLLSAPTPRPRAREQTVADSRGAASVAPQKPKDLIRDWLRQLDELRKLYKFIENRYTQVCLSMKTPRRFHTFDDVENGVRTILSVTLSEFELISSKILLQISQVSNASERGELLQRLKDGTSRYFRTAVKTGGSSFGRNQIAQQHAKVLERLARHYEDTEDDFEAENLHLDSIKIRERYGLSSDASEPDELAIFQSMSTRAARAFDAIKLKIHDPNIVGLFANNVPGFPASHLALLYERPQTAIGLLALSADASSERDILGRQITHIAAETGNVSIVNISAAEDIDIYNMTPVAVAAHAGCPTLFQALAERGHNLEARDMEGRSVLLIAAGAGNTDVVRIMLQRNINPNPYNLRIGQQVSPQYTPLHAAAAGGHVEVAKLLIKNGAMTRWAANDYDYTPTQEAVEHGHTAMEQLLKDAEAAETVHIKEAERATSLISTPDVSQRSVPSGQYGSSRGPMERAQSLVPMSNTISAHYTTPASWARKRTHAQSEAGNTPSIDLTR